MSNKTITEDGYPVNLDRVIDIKVTVGVSLITVFLLVSNGISLVALNRTSHVPKTARFLSSALLVFDFVALFLFTLRKIVIGVRINLYVQIIGFSWSFIAYIVIAIMSLERLLVFQWPNLYLRRFSFSRFRAFALVIWTFYLAFYAGFVTHCFHWYNTDKDLRGCFDPLIFKYIHVTFPASAGISCLCLSKVAFLIRSHTTRIASLQSYKSTITVFLCCLNYLVTAVLYAVVLYVTVTENLYRRVFVDVTMMINASLDICVYVLWYKECRLEVLKMLERYFPSLTGKIAKMRIEIFDIITYSSTSVT